MMQIINRLFDKGQQPKWPPMWHEPQFSPLYDSETGRTCVAMRVSVRAPLFDFGGPLAGEVEGHARHILQIARAEWTAKEAAKAAQLIATDAPKQFKVVLEFAANGAYATRTQQICARFDFDGARIGLLREAGRVFENQTVFQSVTL